MAAIHQSEHLRPGEEGEAVRGDGWQQGGAGNQICSLVNTKTAPLL